MAAVNTDPIYSKVGVVLGGCTLTTAANDYTGLSANNQQVFEADATNGGLIQRLRFKALGTNVASVARIYIAKANTDNLATVLSAVSGTPTGTPSASGGTLASGNYYAKIYAVDQYGKITAASTESAAVSVTGPTGSIAWDWADVTGAVGFIVAVGQVSNGQRQFFTTGSATSAYTQTEPLGTQSYLNLLAEPVLYGEVSLPATTATATAAVADIDYPMGFALPPGYKIFVGLGTTVSAGWDVSAIGGKY